VRCPKQGSKRSHLSHIVSRPFGRIAVPIHREALRPCLAYSSTRSWGTAHLSSDCGAELSSYTGGRCRAAVSASSVHELARRGKMVPQASRSWQAQRPSRSSWLLYTCSYPGSEDLRALVAPHNRLRRLEPSRWVFTCQSEDMCWLEQHSLDSCGHRITPRLLLPGCGTASALLSLRRVGKVCSAGARALAP
jgi:hypothetical protein